MPSSGRADDENSGNAPEDVSRSTGDFGPTNQRRSGIFDNGFEAYRTVTDDDYRSLFASGLIVLDTNVLLDLYRYHPETRQQLLDVLNKIRERLWIPNQVMAEFWARRESVLEDASDITSTVSALDKFGEQYMSRVREWTNRAGLREQTAGILVEISRSAFDATIKKIRSLADDKAEKISKDTGKDFVVIRLDSILQGRVGNPLPAERKRVAINQEAPQRFADKRPPGYMDANKKNGDPVGDYLIWIETLEEAARLKVDVLFVTGDTKEDWWRQERGHTKGPNPQLAEEMRNVSGVRLVMLRPSSFLKHAGDILQIKISPESVQDAQRVSASGATYGRDEATWNELVEAGLDYLIDVASRGDLASYTEFNEALKSRVGSGFDFDRADERGALGYLLGSIVKLTYPQTKVMISALVKYLHSNDPGPGFYQLAQELGLLRRGANVNTKSEFWMNQVRAVHAYYSSSLS